MTAAAAPGASRRETVEVNPRWNRTTREVQDRDPRHPVMMIRHALGGKA